MRLFLYFFLSLTIFYHAPSFAEVVTPCLANAPLIEPDLSGPLDEASTHVFNESLRDCITTAFHSAQESLKSQGQCIAHPIDCVESIGEGIKNIYHFIANIATEIPKVWAAISHLTWPQIREALCTMVGSLAPDILIMIITAGAASGKFGITIARLMAQLQEIAAVIKDGVMLPIRLLAEVAGEALAEMKMVLKSGQREHFLSDLRSLGCAIP